MASGARADRRQGGPRLHPRARLLHRRGRGDGDNCKVQNYALVYEPAVLGDGVFIGPAAVLTNDEYPRAVAPDGAMKSADDWRCWGHHR